MDTYFRAVDQYVDLVEDKLGQLLEPLKQIGYSSAELLEAPFFQQLAKRPTAKGNVIDDYFRLVDYYVSTAEQVLPFLLKLITEKSEEFQATKEKANEEGVLNEMDLLAALGTADLDTVKLTDDYILKKLGIKTVSLGSLKEYLERDELNFFANKVLQQWPVINEDVKYFVAARKIIDEYGQMINKFNDLKDSDESTMPSTKVTQFQLAKRLFRKFDQSKAIVYGQSITNDFSADYKAVYVEYRDARKDITEILLYLKGGVSQAFLILRNTNDIDRTGVEERGKLLKKVDENLVYLDQDGRILGTALDKFQGIFNQHVESAESKAYLQEITDIERQLSPLRGKKLGFEESARFKEQDSRRNKLISGKNEEIKAHNKATTTAINAAILSQNNYNLLEEGGTVVIIAYGQSGSGKTYTLTRLIEHFSSHMNGFNLDGISSVQFYNDVKLQVAEEPKDDIRRLTFPIDKDVPIPEDPAVRADIGYNSKQLATVGRLDPKYNSTKLYDVFKLSQSALTLKIKPAVTSIKSIASKQSPELIRIELFAKKCFQHAKRVNEIVNTDLDPPRSYNRLFEMYRHKIYELRQKRAASVLSQCYGYVQTDGINHLPIYKFVGETYEVVTIDKLKMDKDDYVVCSKYGMQTFGSHKIHVSQADLEGLIDKTIQTTLNESKRDILRECEFSLDNKPAIELMDKYDEFIKMHRAVHVLCDATRVVKKEDEITKGGAQHVYEINNHFFINGRWNESTSGENIFQAHRKNMHRFQSIVTLTDPISNNKYEHRVTPLHKQNASLKQEDGLEFYSVPGYEHHYSLTKEDYGYAFRNGLHRTDKIILTLLKRTDHVDSLYDGAHYYELWKDQDFEEDIQIEAPDKPDKLYCHVKYFFPVIEKKSTYAEPRKQTYPQILDWRGENEHATFEYIASQRQAKWDFSPETYRSEFQHCIQISETGPDNASNYALFDHEELRYPCYFEPKIQPTMDAAFTKDFNISAVGLNKTPLKRAYDLINDARFTRSMPQNPDSSRSQLVTTLHLSKSGKQSKLLFIDLAGNERVNITKRHIVTPESVYINSTLKFVTEMFLRMKEKYPGWIEETSADGSKHYTLLKDSTRKQTTVPSPEQFDYNVPKDTDDPFRRFLYQISTPPQGLKPAIVMVVCAYEYYSSWVPPRPIPEVSRESLQKTFEFISALFHFGADKAAAIQEKQIAIEQEVDPRPVRGGRRRTLHKRIRRTHKKGRRYGTRRTKPRKTRR
jgi:hypothetical protein